MKWYRKGKRRTEGSHCAVLGRSGGALFHEPTAVLLFMPCACCLHLLNLLLKEQETWRRKAKLRANHLQDKSGTECGQSLTYCNQFRSSKCEPTGTWWQVLLQPYLLPKNRTIRFSSRQNARFAMPMPLSATRKPNTDTM